MPFSQRRRRRYLGGGRCCGRAATRAHIRRYLLGIFRFIPRPWCAFGCRSRGVRPRRRRRLRRRRRRWRRDGATAFRQKLCHWAPAAILKISGSPAVVGVEVCFAASAYRVRGAFFVADSAPSATDNSRFSSIFFFVLLPFFFSSFYVSPVASRSRCGHYLCSLGSWPRYRSNPLVRSGWIGGSRVRVPSLCSKKINPWCPCRPSYRAGPPITITGDEVKFADFLLRIGTAKSPGPCSAVPAKKPSPNILSEADFRGNSMPIGRFWK